MMARLAMAALTAGLLTGCALTPPYVQPAAPVPASWPVGEAYAPAADSGDARLPSLGWRDIATDPRLVQLVEQALAGNRDLRVAAANVAAARARTRVQRAAQSPSLSGSVDAGFVDTPTRSGGDFALALAPSFELDLFGRLAAQSDAQQQRYFASAAGARAVRLTIIGDVAEAWLTHAANASLLAIARRTADNARRSVSLTRARLEGGVAPRTDVRQAEQILAIAEGDIARLTSALAQSKNALDLICGAPVDPALLPSEVESAAASIGSVPAGLPSDILLRRPDVMAAEFRLRAANAEIGAARAALFPSISLTGVLGFASDALGSLLRSTSFSASGGAGASITIFRGGVARAGVAVSEAERDAALASYEGAIQSAFRDVADTLARAGTYAAEDRSVRALVVAADDTLRLTDARYRGGVDSFLARLDAERSLYQAQRSLVATQLGQAINRITLYRAIGGDASIDRAE